LMPNCRSITSPIRFSVHSANSKQCCCGVVLRTVLANQRRCSALSIVGRPGIGLACSAFCPPLAYAASQRYTERSLTPKAAATSATGWPRSTAFTA